MSKQQEERESERKPYRKPTLERVKLMPEETVLAACKNPSTDPCPPPGQPGSRLPGS
jgi:hypothetical protein